MDPRRIGKWVMLKWLGIVSLAVSWLSFFCWHRYATIHWHGPRRDWIGVFFGEDMIAYWSASGWLSLLALGLAIVQLVRTRRRAPVGRRVFDIFALCVAVVAALNGWFSMT